MKIIKDLLLLLFITGPFKGNKNGIFFNCIFFLILEIFMTSFCSKIDDVTNRLSAKINHKIKNISRNTGQESFSFSSKGLSERHTGKLLFTSQADTLYTEATFLCNLLLNKSFIASCNIVFCPYYHLKAQNIFLCVNFLCVN